MPKVPAMSACALAEMGKCLSPCNGSVSADDYAAVVDRLRGLAAGRLGRRWSPRFPAA